MAAIYSTYCTVFTGFVHILFRAKVQGFSRTFLSTNLPATCRQARQWELENACKPDIHCALVAQWTCTKVTRGSWIQVSKHFKNLILWLPVMNNCFHWLSFHLKLININIFQSCSIKNQGLSRTKNQFQVISRPWNKTPEILRFQGFSRYVQTLCIQCTCNEWNILHTRVKCFALEYCHNIWRLRSGYL